MALVKFRLKTKLPPGSVMATLTDFGPQRAQIWPNIDDEHFKVHGEGPGWAEVTEGSSIAGAIWEREKYTWNAASGAVAVETIESNTWGPGSRWDYKIRPTDKGGSEIQVTVERHGKGWKGRLIEMGLVAFGGSMLRSQMERALTRSAAQRSGDRG